MDVTKRFKSHNLSVLKTVGQGTYGNVYLCENDVNNLLSIVKDIELNGRIQDHKQDITNEVTILSTLKHPNIIRFYDCYYTDNHVMISMEYASSGNLAEYMYQRYPKLITQQEILFFFSQILLGVDYIHSLNVIHRDLKAENILLTGKHGVLVKIGDFGISKMLARFPKNADLQAKWIHCTKRENWFPSNYSVLCSRHFTDDCFQIMKNSRRLFDSAVPTLNLPIVSNITISSQYLLKSEDPMPSSSSQHKPKSPTTPKATKRKSTHLQSSSQLHSVTNKRLCRRVAELSSQVNNKNKTIKLLRDKLRYYRKKVATLNVIVNELEKKGAIKESEEKSIIKESEQKSMIKDFEKKSMIKESENKILIKIEDDDPLI